MRVRSSIFWLAALACTMVRAEPDAALLGQAQGYPLGNAANFHTVPHRVGSWSALDKVPGIRVRRVSASPLPVPLPPMASPPPIHYRFGNASRTLGDYLERQRTTGLLVLKNGQVVAEHYRYARTPESRFLSMSMAKSVVSLLVGIAADKGLVSLDDRADRHATGLAGIPYGEVTLRNLLRMSSGLTYTETYEPGDDRSRLSAAFATAPGGTLEVLRTITTRHSPPGEVFRYAGAETDVLGRVLAGATGKTLAELTSQWLWQPMGAQDEAFWRIGRDGQEGAQGSFNASLRDWARLGLLLARDGRAGERQVVPRDYLLEATDAVRQPPAFQPRRATAYAGYGYQFWLLPMRERTFAMQGIHGQALYVQPSSGVVMVVTSVWERASGNQDPLPARERDALWRGVLQSLGGSTD